MGYYDYITAKVEDLLGKTVTEIHNKGDELLFTTFDGEDYKMYHSQDCCESVSIEDVCGDLEDLKNSPILLAEEVVSSDPTPEVAAARAAEEAQCKAEGRHYWGNESETWTFYKLSTIKGSVTIRWYGTSNGYYSERVDFVKLK
jgi:hypothetical protein